MTSLINSAFLARRLWDLYAGDICSVYKARHRITRNYKPIVKESALRNNKPIVEDKFKDDKDDRHKEESTARDDKPTTEDKFQGNNNDCRNEESTARDDKPTARMSSKMTTMTVATKNPPQGTTSLPQGRVPR
jgi:hypothetical protein